MPAKLESGSFIEGVIEPPRAELVLPNRRVYSLGLGLLIIVAAVSPWCENHIPRVKGPPGLPFYSGGMIVILAWILASALGYRVSADSDGLRWRKTFRERSAKWDEVTDYYLTWPQKYEPPPRNGAPFSQRSDWHRYTHMSQPEHLTAVIETTRGCVRIPVFQTDRQPLYRLVRLRAKNAAFSRWEAWEYRVSAGGRTFVYHPVSGWELVGRIIKAPFSSEHPLPGSAMFYETLSTLAIGLAGASLLDGRSTRGLWIFCLTVICLIWAATAAFLISWRRECGRNLRGKLTVTDSALIQETPGSRQELKWNEIIELRRVSDNWRYGSYQPWLVRTPTAEIRLYLEGLRDGMGLPAIIFNRSPNLWAKSEPCVRPVGAPKESRVHGPL